MKALQPFSYAPFSILQQKMLFVPEVKGKMLENLRSLLAPLVPSFNHALSEEAKEIARTHMAMNLCQII